MVKLLTFDQALKQAEGGKRHVLLVNGFNRAFRNDLFACDALFAHAQKVLSPRTKKAFHALLMTDFEVSLDQLRAGGRIVGAGSTKVWG
jgi:hypothetical protein